jgi:hypothetical protein
MQKTRKINKIHKPIKEVQRIVSKNPNIEHAFIKEPRKQIAECSKIKQKEHTIIDREKVKSYLGKETNNYSKIHTHLAKQKFALIPSPQDIFNLLSLSTKRPHTIYVVDKNQVFGTIHYMVKNEKSAKDIFDKYKKFKELLNNKEIQNKISSIAKNKYTLEKLYQSFTIYYTIIEIESGKKYFENKYKSHIKSEPKTLEEKTFSKIDFLTNNLLRNKKTLFEIWNLLGIKIRYVPNKKAGFIFDKENLNFVKK